MEQRPDPDALLAHIQEATPTTGRGRLKIFFGAAPGVGKTYAMLSEAREKQAAGIDVLVGIVETHGRAETEALLRGLEVLPRRESTYRNIALREFDLDAALVRHPRLILVDELAHTNAPDSRHAKRWQDVAELLDAGIDVSSTVNVQHVESLKDVVAQITNVVVRETVPDTILERADEIELVDLAPEELLERLREGKVYIPTQAARAMQSFFRKGNLIALRELSLRRTADRVDEQMRSYRRDQAITAVWPAQERLLVAIHASATASRLVRTGRRIATQLRAPWHVVYVETLAELRHAEAERDNVLQALRLAEQLGAEVTTLSGEQVAEELVAFARTHNVSKIILGKPHHHHWSTRLFGSMVDTLLRQSGDIDVHLISEEPSTYQAGTHSPAASANSATEWNGYLVSIIVLMLITGIGYLARSLYPPFAEANIIMAYLVTVMVLALRFGRGPSILAALLGVVAFDFFFVRPFLTFAVSDTQYLLTFAALLIVALVVSTLTIRLRQQADIARQRERRTAALYAISRDLASVPDVAQLLGVTVRHLSETFSCQVVVLLPCGAAQHLQPWGDITGWWREDIEQRMVFVPDTRDISVAQWVFEHRTPAGAGTMTLPAAQGTYLPLLGVQSDVGVLGIKWGQRQLVLTPDQKHLLETCTHQIALALERARLADETQQQRVQVETERLRNTLLSTISHDLRTPLASITGAASALADQEVLLPPATRQELALSISDEAERLNRLVTNLLDMTRLEAGVVRVTKEWQPLEEVVGTTLQRMEHALRDHPVHVELPAGLTLVPLDTVLIGQVLTNLLDNAAKYTPPGSPITLSATTGPHAIEVAVADRGSGLAPGDEQRIFEKFYRRAESTAGAGLGLAISAGIITAHGGRIWAENRPGGGTVIRFTLPLEGIPPQIQDDDARS
ncbi:MAG TPA: sensor histidine kinase KdpD [Kouleothrix sp.]|nr:sensor histidine kinase KdpD [Kouleothrix sp.]